MKTLLAILGAVSLALGIAGIFLPLLPTTPFLLLSAALWVRSSPRLYAWLLAHPRLGPYIRDFREHRAIPLRAKLLSLTLLWLTLGFCALFVVAPCRWAQTGLLLLAGGISYSIGAVFYILKKPNISSVFGFHELFHVCILIGTFFHFLTVVFYVVL